MLAAALLVGLASLVGVTGHCACGTVHRASTFADLAATDTFPAINGGTQWLNVRKTNK